MIVTRNKMLSQILQNTRDIMEHLGIQETTIEEHTELIANHEDRLQAIEAALIEHGVMKTGQLVVPAAITKQIAANESMSLQEFYQLLIAKKVIRPDRDRSTHTMRINGVPIRVVQLTKKAVSQE